MVLSLWLYAGIIWELRDIAARVSSQIMIEWTCGYGLGKIYVSLHSQVVPLCSKLRTCSFLARTLSCILLVFCIISGFQIKKRNLPTLVTHAEASSPKPTDIVFDL